MSVLKTGKAIPTTTVSHQWLTEDGINFYSYQTPHTIEIVKDRYILSNDLHFTDLQSAIVYVNEIDS